MFGYEVKIVVGRIGISMLTIIRSVIGTPLVLVISKVSVGDNCWSFAQHSPELSVEQEMTADAGSIIQNDNKIKTRTNMLNDEIRMKAEHLE